MGVINWTERRPAGDANKNWYGVSSDSDGSNLIAGVYGGRLYTGIEVPPAVGRSYGFIF
jgi:hypothetical protein